MSVAHPAEPLIALIGPTCSGKTRLVNRLVRELPIELINLDSFQIYSHFSVGTGRSDLIDSRKHLYGVVDPQDNLTPDKYVADALRIAAEVTSRARWPLFEGGSISLLRALCRASDVLLCGLSPGTREEVEVRIVERMSSERERALIEEITTALAGGLRNTVVLRDDVVYWPYVQFVEGTISLDDARRRAKSNLLQRHELQMAEYADFDIHWHDAESAREWLTTEIRARLAFTRGER